MSGVRASAHPGIRAVIFDWDGVLLESAEVKTQAFAELFRSIAPNRPEEIVAYHLAHMGLSRYVKFKHIYARILRQPLSVRLERSLGRRFSRLVLTRLLEAPLVRGAKAFLRNARRMGTYRLFVASGAPEDELRVVAKAKGIWRQVAEWHGAPKTKPRIIRDILARHALRPTEVAFVGDAASDRRAADATGIVFIGRVVGPDGPLHGCRYLIRDLSELPSVLRRMTR